MRIVNLPSGSVFAYAGKQYAILKGMEGNETRFKIQEHCHTAEKRYTKKADQVYVFCFSTGQLGSFHKDTGVKHLPYFALPPDLDGEITMSDSPVVESNTALKNLVDQFILTEQRRQQYEEESSKLEDLKNAALKACKHEGFTGKLVRGKIVIEVHPQCINLHAAEILE